MKLWVDACVQEVGDVELFVVICSPLIKCLESFWKVYKILKVMLVV